jgi:hypothetical protein
MGVVIVAGRSGPGSVALPTGHIGDSTSPAKAVSDHLFACSPDDCARKKGDTTVFA